LDNFYEQIDLTNSERHFIILFAGG